MPAPNCYLIKMATSSAVTFNPLKDDGFETPRHKVGGSRNKPTKKLAQSGGTMTSRMTAQSGVGAVMDELDKLQGQQITFQRKIEKERTRKQVLEAKIQEAINAVNYYRGATKSGSVVKDDDMVKKKMIGKLEYQMSEARNKLSALRKQNQALKTEIIEGRQDKLMYLTIHRELSHELKESTSKLKAYKEDINVVNNRKQRKEVEISNQRQQIFEEMDAFSNELQRAKRNISKTQTHILEGIREKLELSFTPLIDNSPKKIYVEPEPEVDEAAVARAQKLQDLLTEVGAESLEDVIINLQKSEEEMYSKYHEIQEMTGEMEKLDVSNKHLEHDLEIETNKLAELEANSERQTQELEENINDIQSQIQKMVASYDKNMHVLQGVQKELMAILGHIAIEGDSSDKAMQATGVTDRNVPQFLGRVEERIDNLIQMNKAAHHIGLQKEDFRVGQTKASKAAMKDFQPNLPSLMDEYEERQDRDVMNVEAEKVSVLNVSDLKDFMRRRIALAESQKREAENPPSTPSTRKSIMSSQRGGTPQRMSAKGQSTSLAPARESLSGEASGFGGFGEEKDGSRPGSGSATANAGAGAVKAGGEAIQTSPIAKATASAQEPQLSKKGDGRAEEDGENLVGTVTDTRTSTEKFDRIMSQREVDKVVATSEGGKKEEKMIDVAKDAAAKVTSIQPTAPVASRPENSSSRPSNRAGGAAKAASTKQPSSSNKGPGKSSNGKANGAKSAK